MSDCDRSQLFEALRPALDHVADRLAAGYVPAEHEAFQHPIGYRKYRFGPLGSSDLTVRAHVWPRPISSAPHQHRWPLATVVCAGSVSSHLFEATSSQDGEWTAHSFETRYAVMAHFVKSLDERYTLTQQHYETTSSEAAQFFIDADKVHSAHCQQAPAVTISVTGPPTGDRSVYFVRAGDTSGVDTGARPFGLIPSSTVMADCELILRSLPSRRGRYL